MSESPTPATRSISPLWILLILPLAPAIGWLVGQSPVPKRVEARPAGQPRASESERPAQATPHAEVSSWTTLDDAVVESRRNGKPVLIDFSAEWCGPCQNLKREVFDDSDYGPLVQKAVIPVSIVDRRHEDGSNPPEVESLYERYRVDAFPTLIVFSPASGRTMRRQGFGDADETATWIMQAAKAVR